MAEIFKEAGLLSFERCRNTFLILLGALFTAYLVFSGKHFEYYEAMIFSFVVAPSGFGVYNKYVNSKFNTAPGQPGKPIAPISSVSMVVNRTTKEE